MCGEIETAICSQRESTTGDFSIARIGDTSLNAIDHIFLFFACLGRNRDLQLAIGVERAALLAFLVAAVRIRLVRPF